MTPATPPGLADKIWRPGTRRRLGGHRHADSVSTPTPTERSSRKRRACDDAWVSMNDEWSAVCRSDDRRARLPPWPSSSDPIKATIDGARARPTDAGGPVEAPS